MGLEPSNLPPDHTSETPRSQPPATVVALIFTAVATLLMVCGAFLQASRRFWDWLVDEAGDVILFGFLTLAQLLAVTVTYFFLRRKVSFRSGVERLSVLLTANVVSLFYVFRSQGENLVTSTFGALCDGALGGVPFAIATLILLFRFPPASRRIWWMLCHIVGIPVVWAVLFRGGAFLPDIHWNGIPLGLLAFEWVFVLSTAYVLFVTDKG